MYTFVFDDNHPRRSATIVAKKLQNVKPVRIRHFQYFLLRIQRFTNVHEMPPRRKTTPGSSKAHSQRAGAETPAGTSSQHLNSKHQNRQNFRNQSKQYRKGAEPSIPKQTAMSENVQPMSNNTNVNYPSNLLRSDSVD